ncbi:hypothetical protein KPL70_017295 [Citrus sinensis]|nr:hypothetical protein KPL70_017295 [Citrus sinensis]
MLAPMKSYDPSKLFGMTHTLLKNMPQPPQPKPKPKPQSRPIKIHQPTSTTTQQQDSPEHTPVFTPQPSQSKDKEPMHQYASHHIEVSTDSIETDTSVTESDTKSSLSTTDSDGAYADITKLLMAQPEETDPTQPFQPKSYFEIPSDIDEPAESSIHQPSQPQAQNTHKLSNDPCLGPSRQLQFVQLPNVSSALAIMHEQFIGQPSTVFEAARLDYLNMKCCSLNTKDLHYKRMSILLYKLNGFNDHTLKHVFLASLPMELLLEIQRQLIVHNHNLDNISLGKIFQIAKGCLEKLCEQQQFFKELVKDKEPFRSTCKKPYLQIKCKDKKDCDCSHLWKRHFKTIRHPTSFSKPKSRKWKKPYRFFRKRSFFSKEQGRKKSSRCFICGKKGHYAKDCPNKKEKAIRLVKHLQAATEYSTEKEEIESYFSEQEDPTDETLFALENSSDDSENDEFQSIFHQQLLSLNTTIQIPPIKLQILPSKFQRPIPAIRFLDIGAQKSMMNSDILLTTNDFGPLHETKEFLSKNFEMKDMGEASYVIRIEIFLDRAQGLLKLSQQRIHPWKSAKQSVIATCTMEAEFVACNEAIVHGLWLRNFISGLRIIDSIAKLLKIYCDNVATIFFSKNNRYSKGAKHMELKYLAVKEEVQKRRMLIEHISTNFIIADPLTKYHWVRIENLLKGLGRFGREHWCSQVFVHEQGFHEDWNWILEYMFGFMV